MKARNAFRLQGAALIDCDRNGHQLAGVRIVVQPFEQFGHAVRNGGAAAVAKFNDLGEIRHRQDARDNRNVDPRRVDPVAESQKIVRLKKILRDSLCCAGVDLALQIVEIGFQRG